MQRFAGYTTATIFLAFLTLVAGRLGAAPINYILLPGSTITPVNGASPTGPTEDYLPPQGTRLMSQGPAH